jgi:hypothetical protein
MKRDKDLFRIILLAVGTANAPFAPAHFVLSILTETSRGRTVGSRIQPGPP